MSLGQEDEPPDLVLKLAFQFLVWEDIRTYSTRSHTRILNQVDLVCKGKEYWMKIMTLGVNFVTVF
ncbi:hypothetical protein QTG54_014302 [Skeletonema marinoi]|uniref:Uncharacterized protein n=1 Tax=Skeletonema marinoi TaxID=267567 RepID=A0AAD9D5V6_9STRA|nr:hypothetical protein QTG54_014302 [Skeletonema marinoi]